MEHMLWEQLKTLRSPNFKWVDLTHEFGADTPRWPGFEPMDYQILFDLDAAPMKVQQFTFPGQYGTHVDAPGHFHAGGRLLDNIDVSEFAYPLCVIDVHEKAEADNAYALTVEDIKEFEREYGTIPEGAFVAMRTDWYKRWPNQDKSQNWIAEGQACYPGWSMESLEFLFEQRDVGAVGHEGFDTDPPTLESQAPFKGEGYVLAQDKFQIEVMSNLDEVPPVGAVIFCTFPKVKGATGFPARCFAIAPA
ncbi:cyclase family protein [Sediminispirochaeta smaragdinae]|uniref:Cyclase family protein n=1 Tax=Sediminispirochaeta smaragdinae (strain DSM 11293 / JCM 15392 / SEBR 4228) TaxID=573413 RepID=E1R482_SEDSS|nr:cyclase family protein [Sediminispirochaeta smaragdinae]ADK80504.1 cyclase family protein [Sediminispirochaeta smaragdinae DSM 11293]